MTHLLKTLFTYAQENRIVYSRETKAQVRQSIQLTEQAEAELMEQLSEKGRQQLENYIQEEELLQCLELEAIFRAGLSIGLELARL